MPDKDGAGKFYLNITSRDTELYNIRAKADLWRKKEVS